MRSSHKNRNRGRHRGGGSGGGNPLNRIYESNGPDVKVRGTAQTVAEKYLQLGRDAQSSGDSVMAENYYQHAEHYLRIVAAAQAYLQQQQQHRRPDEEFDDEDLDDTREMEPAEPRGAQPSSGGGETDGADGQPRLSVEQGDRAPAPQQRQPREANGQQPFPNRDQRRPRWQDRRDQQSREAGEQRASPPQNRNGELSRISEASVAPAVPEPEGQWEAPSFLRRPAAIPAAAEPVADAAPAVGSASPADPGPAVLKRSHARRSRRDATPEAGAAAEASETGSTPTDA